MGPTGRGHGEASEATALQRRLPNALTIARLALAAIFFVILMRAGPHAGGLLVLAVAVFVLAAVTDALDGYYARRWRVVSRFGRIVDPLADKILVLGGFIMLAGPAFHDGEAQVSGVTGLMAIVILARELLVTSLRGLAESAGVDFSATAAGKWKMVAQSLAIPTILLTMAASSAPGAGAARAVIVTVAWATVLVTAGSAVPYVVKAIRQAPPPAEQGAD